MSTNHDLLIEIGTEELPPLALRRLAEAFRRGLDRLFDDHREILVLRHFQDLSYAEIASLLGVAEGTVMSRLARARETLRREVER